MNVRLVSTWLATSALLAITHWFAIEASLYWYYSWFDIIMHLWGGVLVGIGIHILASFSLWRHRPGLLEVIVGIGVVVAAWEVFEYLVGLYDPNTYLFDVTKDVLVGYSGGLLAHFFLVNRYNTAHE